MKIGYWIVMATALVSPFLGFAAEKDMLTEGTFKAKDYGRLKSMDGFGDELISLHLKLYEGYVKNANTLRDGLRKMAQEGKNKGPEYAGFKRMYGWEYDGMRLHEYYFDNLGGDGKVAEHSPLYRAIEKEFGSFDAWKKDFIATGSIRGIGWAALYYDPSSGHLTNAWLNEHDLGHLAGNTPILIMDVFEHAYMPKYGLDRAAYIEAFFRNVNWQVAEDRYRPAM